MNRFGFRQNVAVSILSCAIAGVLMMGCATQASPPQAATDDLNFFVSSNPATNGESAPINPHSLKVDLQVFAEKGQNPVRLVYTVTNSFSPVPILAPISATLYIQEPIKIPQQPTVAAPKVDIVSGKKEEVIAQILKPGESVTGSMLINIGPMQWQTGIGINVGTPQGISLAACKCVLAIEDTSEEKIAKQQGGTVFVSGGTGLVLRTKNGLIEASYFGWPESEQPGSYSVIDGTVFVNPTPIPITAEPNPVLKLTKVVETTRVPLEQNATTSP